MAQHTWIHMILRFVPFPKRCIPQSQPQTTGPSHPTSNNSITRLLAKANIVSQICTLTSLN